jgi:hypothetical protein
MFDFFILNNSLILIKFLMTLLVVDLDQQLLAEFRGYAANKHGKLYGVLKYEVELALKNHLATQRNRSKLIEGDSQ